MKELIVCEGVGFAYQNAVILSKVDLVIKRGENVLIMGKSGCGKTTLLNILGGIVKQNVLGKIVRKCNYSFVFQKPHLINALNVLDNVAMIGCSVRGLSWSEAREEAKEILRNMKIDEEIFDLSVDVLSGGQAQRVAIARALITGVDLLLCDEPTGSLDNETAEMVMDLLIRSGIGLVVISHDRGLMRRFDRVYRLENGELYSER